MLTGIRHLHSTLAICLLLALVIVIAITLLKFVKNKGYNRKIPLIGLISAQLQLVVGFTIYFLSPLGKQAISGENMKNSLSRLYFLEHPLIMILAISLITVGYSRSKKATDSRQANKFVLTFYTLGLILILSRIPWKTWSLLVL